MPQTLKPRHQSEDTRSLLKKQRRRKRAANVASRQPRQLKNFLEAVRASAAQLQTKSDREISSVFLKLRESTRDTPLAAQPKRFRAAKRTASKTKSAKKTNSPTNATNIQAFALATEAVRRTTGKSHYDVQLQTGHILADGDLAEMKTGEGKTIVTLLPTLHAVVNGRRVHVATTNSYLAERDFAELRPAFELLGVSCALLPEGNNTAEKRNAYQTDVVYGTGYEFGYLRDQLLVREQPQAKPGESWLNALAGITRAEPAILQTHHGTNAFIAEVAIDNQDLQLRPGMLGSARITGETHALGWSLFHKPWEHLRNLLPW